MRKHLYAASAILAVTLVFVVSGFGTLTTRAQNDPGSRALRYLASQQSASTGAEPVGFSPYDTTEFYVIGAAAAGYDPKALRNGSGPSVMDYLAGQATPATADAGNTGRLVMAVVAARQDPTRFGGLDLVAKLKGYYSAGVYQPNSAQGQALAVLGLKAAGQSVPQPAIDAIKQVQDSDGGWGYLMIKDDPNASTNFDTSDTNSTAFALMALASVGDHSREVAAIAWLRTQQQPDGGFAYQGSPSDPDSTALVLQALLASGQDPASSTWARSNNSALMYLLAVQDASGGYLGFSGVDPGTTAMAVTGLERVILPVFAAYVDGTGLSATPGPVAANRAPAQLCQPAPAPSQVPSPTPTPTPARTPTPAQTPALTAAPVVPPSVATEPAASPSPPAASPSPSPSATATPAPVEASPQPGPALQPRAGAAGSRDTSGIPAPLLYLLVGAAALGAVVLVGGAFLYLRR